MLKSGIHRSILVAAALALLGGCAPETDADPAGDPLGAPADQADQPAAGEEQTGTAREAVKACFGVQGCTRMALTGCTGFFCDFSDDWGVTCFCD